MKDPVHTLAMGDQSVHNVSTAYSTVMKNLQFSMITI